jgi:TolB-like protein/DNA-binding winged helix-turn-helix (wHTH) protein/Tfp pilus assembly protein PilF
MTDVQANPRCARLSRDGDQENAVIRFGPFALDERAAELRKDGRRIRIQGQPLQVLLALLERPGDVVTRDELRQRLWAADTFVAFDTGLNSAIRRLRTALGDDAERPRFIETLPRTGYRFIAHVTEDLAGTQAQPASKDVRADRRPFLGLAIGGVAVVVAVAAAVAFLAGRRDSVLPRAVPSLAVLPFANLSGEPSEGYLAEALTDELITTLASVSSLHVISRGSAFQYKDLHVSSAAIGSALHVDTLVEGAVVREGGRVRVTAQLIDAATDRHLWAHSYERELREVLALEREVASAIADQIQLTLTPTERAGFKRQKPVNPDAYLAFVKGRSHWNQRTASSLHAGIDAFRSALAIDPAFAEAFAGLGDCYAALGYGSYLSPREAFEPARDAANKALALDPNLADAHAVLGYVKLYYDWDFAAAEREFQQALVADPKSVTAHDWYAVYLTAASRFPEAEVEIQKAQRLDPVSFAINTDAGFVSYYAGRYEEAVKRLHVVLDVNPGFPLAHLWMGRAYEEQQAYVDATREFQQADQILRDWPVTAAALGYVAAASGHRTDAENVLALLTALSSKEYVTPYGVALVYAGLNDRDEAFKWLDRALADRSHWLVWLKLDPRWSNLRGDSRFEALVHRVFGKA